MGNEMLLFVGSITMGALLSANPHFPTMLAHLGLASVPAPMVFPILALALVACAVAGLHASIIGPLTVAVYSGLNGQISAFEAVLLLLFGWSSASMLSISSLGVAVVTRGFGLTIRDVAFGSNLVFALKLAAALSMGFAIYQLAAVG